MLVKGAEGVKLLSKFYNLYIANFTSDAHISKMIC